MSKVIQFGEKVEGYDIPVLNEREIRASSGILFVIALISLMLIIFKVDFILAKYFVLAFFLDFSIRVFINPKFSPTLIIGRLIVSKQTPEYVGAPQKKFAWIIGLVLASLMFILLNILNTYSFITGLICLICLLFLFFESAFGICLGCMFYGFYYKENAQYCPGEICDISAKQKIQETSKSQIIIALGFILFIILAVYLLNDMFGVRPSNLWKIFKKE